MADNKAVNQTAAKPEEAKADKKAKANDGKKKVPFTAKVKNFFGRIPARKTPATTPLPLLWLW